MLETSRWSFGSLVVRARRVTVKQHARALAGRSASELATRQRRGLAAQARGTPPLRLVPSRWRAGLALRGGGVPPVAGAGGCTGVHLQGMVRARGSGGPDGRGDLAGALCAGALAAFIWATELTSGLDQIVFQTHFAKGLVFF